MNRNGGQTVAEYTHIIFDIDGTLTDTRNALIPALRQTLRECGREMNEDELLFSFGIPGLDTMRQLGIEGEEAKRLIVRWNELARARKHLVTIYDGAVQTLDSLRAAGKKLGVITSKNLEEYETDFIPLGLADYFDIFVVSNDTTSHKPDSEPMRFFLNKAGIAPEQALYVGDTGYDWKCAAGAGVKFALATWGCVAPGDVQPDYAPETLLDLLEIAGV